MRYLQDFFLTCLFIYTGLTVGAIYGCSEDRVLACEAVNTLLSENAMIVIIIIFICFLLALWGNARNRYEDYRD